MNCTQISARLTPRWEDGHIGRISVRITAAVEGKEGEMLFFIHRRTVNKQFLPLEGGFSLRDEAGPLGCAVGHEDSMYIEKENYLPQRDPVGAVTLQYTAVLAPAAGHPGFDLGYEDGGMTGSGMTFMPCFAGEGCALSMDWDLSGLPAGCRGVWAYGEGRTAVTGAPSLFMETFYCAGLLKGVDSGHFGFYWLDNPAFDAEPIAGWTRDIFLRMSGFFGDDGSPYRIFARKASCNRGGTALSRSYQYIYPPDGIPSLKDLKFLFAHEMVHDWIKMKDEPFGACTWYVEGMAEFYSAVLPLRYGLVTKEELTAELNRRAEKYYRNPFIAISNEEAGRLLFKDDIAMRVPYGRGFFYLAETDSKIRRATGGEKSLDDVMRSILEQQRTGEMPQNRDWLDRIVPLLGGEAVRDFESMTRGRIIEPAVDCFGGAVTAVKSAGTVQDTDTSCVLWRFE